MTTGNIWLDALICALAGICFGALFVYSEVEREKFLRGDYDKVKK